MPFINWVLYISVVILILLFEKSEFWPALMESVHVTMTMLCGTILIVTLAYWGMALAIVESGIIRSAFLDT